MMASKDILGSPLSISYFTQKILDRILTFSQFLKQPIESQRNVQNVYVFSLKTEKESIQLKYLEVQKQNIKAIEEAFKGTERNVNIDRREFNLNSKPNSSNIFPVILELLSLLVEGNLCVFDANADSEFSLISTVMLSYLEGIQLERCLQSYRMPSGLSCLLSDLRVVICKIYSVRSCLLKSQNFSLIPVATFVVQENPYLEFDLECKSEPPFECSSWIIQGKLLIGSSTSLSLENINANEITVILELIGIKGDSGMPQFHSQSLKYMCFDFLVHHGDVKNSVFSMVLRVVGLIQSGEKVAIAYTGVDDSTFLACILAVMQGLSPLDATELAARFHRRCRLSKGPQHTEFTTVDGIIKSLHSYKLTLKMPSETSEYFSKFLSKLIPPLAKETDPVMGPIDSSHWVIFNHLIAGSNPDSYGSTENLERILSAGVNTFVNLQESYEQQYFVPYKNQVVAIAKAKYKRDVKFISLEIEDMNVTTDENILELVFKISSLILSGDCVYVHCWGGFGRTGTVIAILIGYLYGKDAETCLKLTTLFSQKRVYCGERRSPTTSVQFNQVRRVTSQLNPI